MRTQRLHCVRGGSAARAKCEGRVDGRPGVAPQGPRGRRWMAFAGLMITATLGAEAIAQNAPTLPTGLDPTQLERRFEAPPQALSPTGPTIPAPVLQAIPAGAAETTLTVRELRIDGSSVYGRDELEAIGATLLGETVARSRVYELAHAVTRKYHGDGYVLSFALVPNQNFAGGVVSIRVVEGYVGNVAIEGDLAERRLIEQYAARIRLARPLHRDTLERYVLLINDLPGVAASSSLSAPGRQGLASMALSVSRERWDASATLDNRGSRPVGPYQVALSGGLNSALGAYERTTLGLNAAADFDEFHGVNLGQEVPIGSDGLLLTYSGGYSRSQPGFTIGQFQFETHSVHGQAGLRYPWIRSADFNLLLSATLSARNSRGTQAGTLSTEDNLRTLSLRAHTDFADGLAGSNLVAATVHQGLDILGASDEGSAEASRADGKPDATVFALDAARTQSLPVPGLSARFGFTGQYALDPLLSPQEFAFGGAQFGRAFDPGEIAGDHGLALSSELRYGRPVAPGGVGDVLKSYQVFAFYDWGHVWQRGGGANRNDRAGASVGGGMRFSLLGGASASVEAAKPMITPVGNLGTEGKDWRVFFSVGVRL